jgi:hypothetical protein
MIAVGRIAGEAKPLPMGEVSPWQPLPVLRPSNLLEGYWKGEKVPGPAYHMDHVSVFLVGPVLNGGEAWGPARLLREGNNFTLRLEGWRDDAPRRRNVPARSLYVVDLGELPAGKYDLDVVWRTMFAETAKTAPLSRLQSVKKGRLQFDVSRALTKVPRPGDGLGDLPMLQEKDLQKCDLTADETRSLWQRPVCWQRQLAPPTIGGRAPQGLRVGTFDLTRWLASNPKAVGDMPELASPGANQLTYALILGPQLNSGEWMTLREVQWQDNQATLTVDLWRDNAPRYGNVPTCPLLIVPLRSPSIGLPAGDYTIKVRGGFLWAPNMGGPYRLEEDKSPVAAGRAGLLQPRSKVELSVK